MNNTVIMIISVAAYVILAPFIGGLLAGIDRKISAGFQGRVGPPILQPFYDVSKLWKKDLVTVKGGQDFFVGCFLFFMVITGGIFFAGLNIFLVIFVFTTAAMFLVLAAFSSNSPYAQIGAHRELLQMMSYEPMVILMGVGLVMAKNDFTVKALATTGDGPWTLLKLAGIFIGYVFILTIKFRKSPFDLSMSHHAHQEIVKGVSTEFSGKTMGILEITHWYENVLLLAFVYLFLADGTILMGVISVCVALILYILEIVIDNTYARLKWQFTLKITWIITIIFAGLNIFGLYMYQGKVQELVNIITQQMSSYFGGLS